MIDCSEKEGSLVLAVHVVPGASRSEIAGEHNGALRVRIAAPPADGAANKQLVLALARAFSVRLGAIEIIRGHTSRTKQVRVIGGSTQVLRELLA